MSMSDPHPGISVQETSTGVPPVPGIGSESAVLPPSAEDRQTSVDTNSSNIAPLSPPVDQATNATGIAGLSYTVSQPSLNGGSGEQAQKQQLDLDALEMGARHTGTYTGALIMTSVAVPIVAAIISAFAFVVHWPTGVSLPDWLSLLIGTPLLIGTIPTLIVWLLLAIIVRRFTAVDRMNMTSYGMLLNRLSILDAQLDVLFPEPATIPPTVTMASKEVLDSLNAISKKLVKKTLAWVTATGYINLWKEVHDAEEAFIEMLPRETVIAGALYDESRIQDSKINTSADLLNKLRVAVMVLDPSAKKYLQSLPSDPVPPDVTSEAQARAVLREVRHSLNEFRDDRWEAIVRVRNQFVNTAFLTGLTMYVLLQFAILAGAPQPAIISATAFFLVGALIGLFVRLYNESQTSKSIDDYRLALVRLVATPLYTGLAAVGGVLITQKFTTLVDIYDPKNILSGLVVAAAFSLTPGLLINTLQKQTETYKNDLKSTAATQRQATKTS